MKFIRFALFILYSYYRKGRWERAPIFHAAATLALFLWMNIVSVICFAGHCNLIFNSQVYVLSTLTLIMIGMYLFARNCRLMDLEFKSTQTRKARWFLAIYFIASFAVLIISFLSLSKENGILITPLK